MNKGGWSTGTELTLFFCLESDSRIELLSFDLMLSADSGLILPVVWEVVAVCRSLKRSRLVCTMIFSLHVKTFLPRSSDSSFWMAYMQLSTSSWTPARVVRPCDAAAVSIKSFSVIKNARLRREDGAGPSRVYFSNLGVLASSKLGNDK